MTSSAFAVDDEMKNSSTSTIRNMHNAFSKGSCPFVKRLILSTMIGSTRPSSNTYLMDAANAMHSTAGNAPARPRRKAVATVFVSLLTYTAVHVPNTSV